MNARRLAPFEADFLVPEPGFLGSLLPLAQQYNVSLAALGDFNTLPDRIQAEVVASNTVVRFVPIVWAGSRKPPDNYTDHYANS